MTTITTEKIEELISELYNFYGLEHWITIKGVKQPSSFDLSRSPLISRAIEMLRAYASQLALPAGLVPEGYKLVPLEPTKEMVSAGEAAWEEQLATRLVAKHSGEKFATYPSEETHELCSRPAYRAMLAASPSPAVAQPDNTAAWESGELGRSAEHAKVAPAEIERQVAAAVAQPVVSTSEVAWQIRRSPNAEWICAFDKKDAEDYVRLHGWEMRSLGVIAANQAAVAQPVAEVDQHHFVQPVPDHCDRITWRNRYYHLPLNDGAQPVADEREAFEAFAKEKMFDLDSGQHGYTSWPTSMAWYVWQVTRKAARAALCPPAEEGGKS